MIKSIFKITIYITFLFLSLAIICPQDDLIGPKNLMEKLSEQFKNNVKDFKADIKWTTGDTVWTGKIFFKNPQKLKVEFKDPPNQVICTNGYELWVFIPALSAILHQNILDKEKKKNDDGSVETIKNPILLSLVGYDKFLSDYSIEYDGVKEKVAFKDTQVYKLKLIRWKSSRNGINTIYLLIQDNGIIRQIKGITASFRQITIDYDNVTTNSNIGDMLFNYEPPAHATVIDDFMSK
jgi:outer membrane lipoprotein-sorting protein